MKYKVGDKVRIVSKWGEKNTGINSEGKMDKWLGKVMTIRRAGGAYYKMEEDKGEHINGWLWSEDEIEGLATECNQKIVITADGKETLARLYDGKNVIKTATAKCAPDDTFDFATGAKLAFDRLMGETKPETKTEEKLRYYNGKVVCVSNEIDFTIGKIYEFKDGKVTDDGGDRRPMGGGVRLRSLDDCWAKGKFIPYVE